MVSKRKNFIPRHEAFQCEHCGAQVSPARGTFRNHCPVCLYAKHVDQETPGDRAATCQGLMPPIGVEGTDPDKLDLIHRCVKCGKTIKNKIASDDNKEVIWQLMENRPPRPSGTPPS